MTTEFSADRKPKIWTRRGLGNLGRIIRASRTAQSLSLDRVVALIHEKTLIKISKKTLGNVENNVGMPHYNTLAIIAATGFVADTSNRILSVEDFMDIACEISDPSY